MFFVLSKVLWFLAAPANLITLVLVLGALLLLAGAVSWARRLLMTGVAALVICGVLPTGALMLRVLEDRFPQPDLDDIRPAGIIVLGGPINQVIGRTRRQVTVSDAATRMTAAVTLSRRFPDARLVYTGGSSSLLKSVGSEADDARRLWIEMGVAPGRIVIEPDSRNTDENAQFTRALLRPEPQDRYLLVTSAYHMARSVGLFRATGFATIPYPVDYRTTGTWRDFEPTADIAANLARFNVATREWIGLAAYRLSGKIAEAFPAP